MNALLFGGLRQNPPSSFSLVGMAHKKDQKGIKLQLTHFGWYTKQSNTASKKPTSFILWKTLCGRYSGATPRISFVSSCFHKSTAQSTTTSYVPIIWSTRVERVKVNSRIFERTYNRLMLFKLSILSDRSYITLNLPWQFQRGSLLDPPVQCLFGELQCSSLFYFEVFEVELKL